MLLTALLTLGAPHAEEIPPAESSTPPATPEATRIGDPAPGPSVQGPGPRYHTSTLPKL